MVLPSLQLKDWHRTYIMKGVASCFTIKVDA